MFKLSQAEQRREKSEEAVLEEFASYLAERGIDKITPLVSPATEITYPKIHSFAQSRGLDERELLEASVKAGLLRRRVYDRVVRCPKCGSIRSVVRLHCPHCGSHNVEPARILTHVLCGYTGIEPEFKKEDGEVLVCPSCGRELGEGDCEVIGDVFSCLDCSSRFPMPDVKFECKSCGSVFGIHEIDYTPVYEYEVVKEALSEVSKRMALDVAKGVLRKHGFRLVEPPVIVGDSGITHTFDIVGVKKDKKVAISHYDSSSGESLQRRILDLLGRATDLSGVEVLDLVKNDDEETARALRAGRTSKNVLTYGDVKELEERLADRLKKLEGS